MMMMNDTATVIKHFVKFNYFLSRVSCMYNSNLIEVSPGLTHICMCFSSFREGEDKAESKGQGGERERKTPNWAQLAP